MKVGHPIEARTCSCSDRKMKEEEEGEGMRLKECLRGRLLAERQASRAATEEAVLMGKRLVELERKLREETKLRDKAQRKLEFLKKKLKGFEALTLLERSGKSIDRCDDSCRSSSTASSEEKQEMARPLTHNHLPLPDAAEEKLGLQKSDLLSDDASSSSSTRTVAVHPAAPEAKELEKVSRNGGGASWSQQKLLT